MFYIIRAFCINALLLHGTGGTESTESAPAASAPVSAAAANKLCKIAYVTVGHNETSVAKSCMCEEKSEDRHVNEVSLPSSPNGGSNAVTAEPHDWVEGTGVVPNGTLCLVSLHDADNAKSIVAGVCNDGKCDDKTTKTIHVPLPPQGPYAYHCKEPTVAINKKLNVSTNCTATCYNRTTNAWVGAGLSDGRLCALIVNGNQEEYVKRTGVCLRGSCVPSDSIWFKRTDCPVKYMRRNGITLAEKCTVPCKNSSKSKRLPRGTRCWLNYDRKINVPGVESNILDGICKHGVCIITPPAVPLLNIHVPEEKCDHLLASVNYTMKVAASCNALCAGREQKYQPLHNGTACALKMSWRQYKRVTEVGVCQAGSCIKDDHVEFPPPHQQKSNSTCRTDNYVEVKPGKITVVASCQVECSYGEFERRSNGVGCLREYSESKRGEKVYTIGTCASGFCALGLRPRNITTTD